MAGLFAGLFKSKSAGSVSTPGGKKNKRKDREDEEKDGLALFSPASQFRRKLDEDEKAKKAINAAVDGGGKSPKKRKLKESKVSETSAEDTAKAVDQANADVIAEFEEEAKLQAAREAARQVAHGEASPSSQ